MRRIAKRVVIGVLLLAFIAVAYTAVAPKLVGTKLYGDRLDAWVAKGGPVSDVQSGVVENCGKLVMASAGLFDNLRFVSYDREDFDFRVDVCTKMTVNRVHNQPEFANEKAVSTICDGKDDFFRQLCRQSGLRPN